MADRLAQLEEQRLSIVKETKKDYRNGFFGILAMIVGFAIMMLATNIQVLGVIFIIIGILVAAIFFTIAGSKISKFKSRLKLELVTTLLEEEFEGVTYAPNGKVRVSRIISTKTVKKPDRYSGEDYMKGTYKNIQFEVSDVDLKERHVHRDSKGHTHVTYETYFKGRWYIYTFPKNFNKTLKIMEARGPMFANQGLVKVETESIAFNKKFDVYATDLEFGFYHITSSMLEKLMDFEKMHRGSILYCIQNNELHIGVNDRRDYMEISYRKPISRETLGDLLDQIELIPAVINEFRLYSTKFK